MIGWCTYSIVVSCGVVIPIAFCGGDTFNICELSRPLSNKVSICEILSVIESRIRKLVIYIS